MTHAGSSYELDTHEALRELACATGAQFPEYHSLAADGELTTWRRFHGW
jgi:hypothetical protein